MVDPHVLYAGLSVAIGAIGYFFYFRSIFWGETKPHIFTWFTYAIIDSIVFLAQLLKGGGPGAAALGFSAMVCIGVSIVSLKRGEREITRSDWLCFIGAFVAILVWRLTSDPLGAVIVATGINALALIPTFRKSYVRPNEESLSTWVADILKYSLSIVALNTVSLTTALFPAAIVICNSALTALILLRRKQLGTLART